MLSGGGSRRGQPSLYSDAGLRQLLAIHQGETTFAELPLPLRIIAADLTTGTRAVIGVGARLAQDEPPSLPVVDVS